MVPTAVGASGRRRPAVVRTHMPKPCPCDDQWRATANAAAISSRHTTTSRRALRLVHAVDPVPQSGKLPPPPARDAGPVTVVCSRAGAQVPFFLGWQNQLE